MRELSKSLKKELRQHADRAWEAEMKAALGALAAKFDEWRAGSLSSADLDSGIHAYHDGIAREIWRRFSGSDRKIAIAHAVAAGLIDRSRCRLKFKSISRRWWSSFGNRSRVREFAVEQRDPAAGLCCHGPCDERTVRASPARS
jgi:hypothetical protein